MIDRVDVIISTKNRSKALLETIGIMISLGFEQKQFFIIDDGSTDDTFEMIQHHFPNCNLRRNKISKGYIENRSFLMQNTKNDFVLSIDDDSNLLREEDLLEAISILDENVVYGIFHFKPYNQINPPPLKNELSSTFRKLRGYVGCGHLIKREVIEKVGGYHSEFEFYCEELDFSLRALNKGYLVVGKDDLIVHHRVDFNKRKEQKNSKAELGVYGSRWRKQLLFSNNILLCFLHYPFGLGSLFAMYKYLLASREFLFKEFDFLNFWRFNVRIFKKIPFVINKMEVIKFSDFFQWFKLKYMTSSH